MSATVSDALLDRFMPSYDVREQHYVLVAAPAAITFAAAREMNLFRQPLVQAIFKARDLILGATPDASGRPDSSDEPSGLVAEMQAIGWGVLAETPEREIVLGAVTRPWEANVTFQSLPPEEFATFNSQGFVKIAVMLRADPISSAESLFRTETRATATDDEARSRFRKYWAFVSPGIRLIRRLALRPLKTEAERHYASSNG